MQNLSAKIKGSNNLPITIDVTYKEDGLEKPVVIFCHGFKGFKDWGAWHLVANKFAKNDFIFVKFNFSHNGTSPENLLNFINLQAFSENNYSRELEDLQKVIDWSFSKRFVTSRNNRTLLIGHSRGGGAVLVKGFEENRITKTCTWAAIDTYERFGTKEQIAAWEQAGEHIFVNGRTGQKMPIKFDFYKNYLDNKTRLYIEKAVKANQKPVLVVHGTNDSAVNFESAKNIVSWSKNASILKVENANHVFGSKHPYIKNKLPKDLNLVVNKTIEFFRD